MTKREEPGSLAIILLCWNNEIQTMAMASSLLSCTSARDQIYVVDNGSEKQFEKISHPNLTVIHSPQNLGFAGGNNLGIKIALEAKHTYILLLNTDLMIECSQIESMLETLKNTTDVALLGPLLAEGNQIMYGGRDPGRYLNTRLTSPQSSGPDYIPGTVFLGRAEVFRQIGLFDENYFFSVEVADFCARAARAGLSMQIDDSTMVAHELDRQNLLRETLYVYYNFRNRFLYIRKHHNANRYILFIKWLILALVQAAGALKQGNLKKVRAIRLALVHGLLGKFGNQNDRFIKVYHG